MYHILSGQSPTLKCQSARGHSNKTKQDFGLTGFPKASEGLSRVSAGSTDGEASATLLHFGLPYRWAWLQAVRSHVRIKLGHQAVTQFNDI